MRTLLCVLTAGLLLGSVVPAAAGDDDDRRWRRRDGRIDRYDVRGDVHVVFSRGDVRVIRDHYRPRYRRLPPGLQKRYARTGQLPPGWARRVEPFPVVVERRLGRLPRGYRRGVYDGHAVIYSPRGVVIDATVIF